MFNWYRPAEVSPEKAGNTGTLLISNWTELVVAAAPE
jgi:hypothetical protein